MYARTLLYSKHYYMTDINYMTNIAYMFSHSSKLITSR